MKSDPIQPEKTPPTPAAGPAGPGTAPAAGDVMAANKLTPEEQMALFEKELKENDWGHQPC